MKGVKIVGGILLALGLGALIYFGVTSKTAPKDKDKPKEPDVTPPVDPIKEPTPPAPPVSSGFPLVVGMKNNSNVKEMQLALIKKFPGTITAGATGNFGAQTIAALYKGGYLPPIAEKEYNNILAGRSKGETATDPNALKKGDTIKMKSDAGIYSSIGYGFVGTIPGKDAVKVSVKTATYLAPAVSGWDKIRTAAGYYTDYNDVDRTVTDPILGSPFTILIKGKRKFVYQAKDVYVRSHLIEKV